MNIQATSLQDDIAKVLRTSCPPIPGGHAPVVRDLAAGLERDYYLVKLADLPEVTDHGDYVIAGSGRFYGDSAEFYHRLGREYLAVALHRQARESEAAVLARRRDELARTYSQAFNAQGYDDLTWGQKEIVIDLINAEDARAAAEAEVARLKEGQA